MAETKQSEKKIAHVVGIIGGLVAVLLGIITARDHFSRVFVGVAVAVLLFMIVVVNGYGILGEHLRTYTHTLREVRRRNRLARTYFDRLIWHIDKLEGFLTPNRCDTIENTLTSLRNAKPELGQLLMPSACDVLSLVGTFKAIMSKLPRNGNTFLLLVYWFGGLFAFYNKCYVCEPVTRIRNMVQQGRMEIPVHIREEYEQNRSAYDRFLLDYMDFAKAVNKDFASNEAREWLERPKRLDL